MMKPLVVFWDGEVVGEIREPDIETFHLSGRWMPRESPALRRFLDCFSVEDAEVMVGLGDDEPSEQACIYEAPGEFIELNIIPGGR